MIGYASMIRMLTGGESSFSMTFQKYQPVPENVVDDLKQFDNNHDHEYHKTLNMISVLDSVPIKG